MTTKTTIQLASNFTDATLPKDRVDPVLPDTGALVLVDLAHPANPGTFPALNAVPANGTVLHNIANVQAAAMVGSGDATTLGVKFGRGSFATSTLGKIERTSKGGIHVITSKATDPGKDGDPGSYGASLYDDNLLRTYLFNNPSHVFYYSQWMRVTRARSGGSDRTAFLSIASGTSPSANYRAMFSTADFSGTAGVTVSGSRSIANTLSPSMPNLATRDWAGTAPTGTVNFGVNLGLLGVAGPFAYTAAIRQAKADGAIYRVYVEDLTVSGRSYATVDALDSAQYTKDVLTTGGRFFGDTFTDPTTLA